MKYSFHSVRTDNSNPLKYFICQKKNTLKYIKLFFIIAGIFAASYFLLLKIDKELVMQDFPYYMKNYSSILYVFLLLFVYSSYSLAFLHFSFKHRNKYLLTELYLTGLTRKEVFNGLKYWPARKFRNYFFPLTILILIVYTKLIYNSDMLIIPLILFPILIFFIINKSYLICRDKKSIFFLYSLCWIIFYFLYTVYIMNYEGCHFHEYISVKQEQNYFMISFLSANIVLWFFYSRRHCETIFFLNTDIEQSGSYHPFFNEIFFWMDIEQDSALRKWYYKLSDIIMAILFACPLIFIFEIFNYKYYLNNLYYRFNLPDIFMSEQMHKAVIVFMSLLILFSIISLIVEVTRKSHSKKILAGILIGMLISLWGSVRGINYYVTPLQFLNIPVFVSFLFSYRRILSNRKGNILITRGLNLLSYILTAYLIYEYGKIALFIPIGIFKLMMW